MISLLMTAGLLTGTTIFDAAAMPSPPTPAILTAPGGTFRLIAFQAVDGPDDKSADNPSADEDDANEDADQADSEAGKGQESSEADEPTADEDEQSEAQEERELYEVKRRDLSIQLEMDGVFVAEEMEEVALRPEVWTDFNVQKAVDHGARVRKGDVLVEFDDRDFEETLAQKSLEQRIEELALREAEEELPRTEKSAELNYTMAKRSLDFLRADYERFQNVVRDMSEKMAMRSLASNKFSLESAQEELEQLRKMYEADELTEETEEIVLKRQEFTVASYELYLEAARINFETMMEITLPRRDETYALNLEAAQVAFDQAKMEQSLGLNRQQYELEKMRLSRTRNIDQHAKLVADRAMMKLRAPMDGIVYYGRCKDGKFSEISSLAAKLVPYASVTPNTVLMTVVKDRPMRVETSVDEEDFPSLEQGQSAEITPTADDEVELAGSVEKISAVPQAGNEFGVTLDVDVLEGPKWLVPGMTCKAKVTTYATEDAVVIPSDLLQSDAEDEGGAKYVMVLNDDEHLERRELKLGREDGDDVEVLDGLQEGDQIAKGVTAEEAEEDDEDEDDEEGDDDADEGDDED